MSTNSVAIHADDENLAGKVLTLPAIECIQIIIDLGIPFSTGKNGLKDWSYQIQMALQSLLAHGWPSDLFTLAGNRLSCVLEEPRLIPADHDLRTAFLSLQQFASDKVQDGGAAAEMFFPHILGNRPCFENIRIVAVWHEEAFRVSLDSKDMNLVGPAMGLAEELLQVCGNKEMVINATFRNRLMAYLGLHGDEMDMVRDVLGPCERLITGNHVSSYYRTREVLPVPPQE